MITNEDKAKEISGFDPDIYEKDDAYAHCIDRYFSGEYDGAIEMAQWKDQQFQQKVELLELSLKQDFYPYLNEHRINLLEKIIKEFKEL